MMMLFSSDGSPHQPTGKFTSLGMITPAPKPVPFELEQLAVELASTSLVIEVSDDAVTRPDAEPAISIAEGITPASDRMDS